MLFQVKILENFRKKHIYGQANNKQHKCYVFSSYKQSNKVCLV